MLRDGDVVEGNYRVGVRLSATDRAEVYAVSHVRFEGVRLAMKVAANDRAHDFDRDTNALASLTSPCIAHVYDRGKLADGRLFRVVEQLDGPPLREALGTGTFDDARTMTLVVALAALLHEAAASGIGPCDLGVDNLMFANGRDGRLCLLRAIIPQGVGVDVEADRAALAALRVRLQRGTTSDWRPPSSMAELRAAVARSGKTTPQHDTSPGERVQRWRVGTLVSETLRASVHEAVPHAQTISGKVTARCVLKLAGPESDHAEFVRHARMLAQVTSKHVVRVHDVGTHQDVPYYVMDALHQTLAARTASGPLPVDVALQTTDELLWGALAIDGANGAPSDFSLDHAWQATPSSSPAALTHALAPLKGFRLYGGPPSSEHADAWSAAVTLYELIAGRLPFPTSKHSLAKAWLGVPVPLTARRREVPVAISDLVHAVLTGMKISTADLRRELTRIRSTTATMGSSFPPPLERTSRSPSLPPLPPLRAPTPVLDASLYPSIAPRASIAPSVPTALVDMRPWRFLSAPARCPIGYVHCASFRENELAAVGPGAVARYRMGQWTVDPARDLGVLAIVPFAESGFLALSARGALLRLDGPGGFRPWGPPLDRFVLWCAAPDGDGVLLAGGTADGRAGVVARLVGESVTVLADHLELPPIRALAPAGGGTFVGACERGTIVQLRGGIVLEQKRLCDANLLAVDVVAATSEIFIVGQGAWAFRCALGPIRTHAEPVDTTSSLGCLAHDGATVWVGSERGRILRRHQGHWRRMNASEHGEAAVLALEVSADRVRALLADGQLLVGQPA